MAKKLKLDKDELRGKYEQAKVDKEQLFAKCK